MDTKQWVYVYHKLKIFFQRNEGKIPDNDIATQAMMLYISLMEITEKSRNDNPDMDKQLHNIMNYVFDIIHSLEAEGKAI